MGKGCPAVTANEAAKWRTSVCVTPVDISKDIWGYNQEMYYSQTIMFLSPKLSALCA